MLVIRPEQMEVFKQAALRNFENEMVTHLAEFSPPLFKAIGEEQMRQAIQFGMNRAESYGFTLRGPVRLYLELMLLFGSYFDTDPQYPWAFAILTDRDAGPQMQRAERLYEKTMDYRQQVAGPEDVYTLKALKNIAILVRQSRTISSKNFVADMRQEISFIYPQKATYVGDEGLKALIHEGIGEAQKQRFSTVREVALLIVLMLIFGHRCAEDPLYSWIARPLQDEAITDPETRAKCLEKEALTRLENMLVYVEGNE